MVTTYCPSCGQLVYLRDDGKVIGLHFANPKAIRPCPKSYQSALTK